VVPFAESLLSLLTQPVTIALGRIFDMDPYVRERWRRNRHHGHGGLVGGVILAGIGVLLLLQNLGIPYFEDLERYWPVILIVVGSAQAARSMGIGGKVWGGAVVVVGIIFLLNNLGMIHAGIGRIIWPGILIMIGFAMLARALDRQAYGGKDGAVHAEDARRMGEKIRDRIVSDWNQKGSRSTLNYLNEWAVFGGTRRRIDSQDFQGGEVFAMFGGVEIDLRKAGTTREEVRVEVNAIFGGVEMRVPENWNVTVRGAGIFGGYEDKTMDSRLEPDAKRPHLIIDGYAVFGGVTIQN
jgi:predicted membrane protein